MGRAMDAAGAGVIPCVDVMRARRGCAPWGWRILARGSMVAVALAAGACGGAGAHRPPPSGPRLTGRTANALQATLRREVSQAGIPGASAAIVFPDGREWTGVAGEAVLRPRTPMTPGTSLSFDSVTKVAVAATALRLAEQGRLGLDDRVRRWYPHWRGDRSATLRDLLGHTSGMGNPRDSFFVALLHHPQRRFTAREALAATPRPGPRTHEAAYSNSAFILLDLILRRAAGEPTASAMRRLIFAAPGGDGLALQPDERPHRPLAAPYWYPHGGAYPADASDGGAYLPSRAWASGTSTAGALAGDEPSLARWGHALLGGHVLRPGSLRAMTRFHHAGEEEGYGLGLTLSSIDERPMWGHTGDGHGTHTEFWHLPLEDLTIAMTWNDDALDSEAPFVPSLLRVALVSR
jgi:D-alanyl-D-alanine carboxypeptidase